MRPFAHPGASLAGAFLTHYFPASHQLLLQPQHTFRKEASPAAQKIVAKWSTTVAPSESVREDESREIMASAAGPLPPGYSPEPDVFADQDVDVFAPLPLDFFDIDPPVATSTPSRQQYLPPSSSSRPRVEGPSSVADAVVDINYRLTDATPAGLQRPDLSIIFQNIPMEENPRIVENIQGSMLRMRWLLSCRFSWWRASSGASC
ncbi:hypothetical protein DFH06DRAFT_1220967 [Mycena polygramma]|nr:hypothetical protein DFH06DRAFT_1220967 [Mycena polygramma]